MEEARQLELKLKRKEIVGSFNVAKATVELLRSIVTQRWNSVGQLMDIMRDVGRRLVKAQPLELACGNVIRRVLFLVRTEYTTHVATMRQQREKGNNTEVAEEAPPRLELQTLLHARTEVDLYSELTKAEKSMRQEIIQAINEFLDEISSLYANIAETSLEHIHANEVIMTFGKSNSVCSFLEHAAQKRKFEVIVPDSAPMYVGHEQAVRLSKAGIRTTVISDADIFSMMARVNKVIVGTHAVLADGSLIAPTGSHMVALAAKHHAVPFVVCTGLYKLSPLYPHDFDILTDFRSPAEILQPEVAGMLRNRNTSIENPTYDHIPAELVTLFVTNVGANNASYIYRLLAEYYYPEDREL
eukprot:TRINITY_DN7173_c0_g1_i1.p1 TRINITY_DN7173_c0_g1~~TRINITY_DN7173_c0_g1_i1.p1  ORF type:complete len:357 (-),score=95.49 TRINITY_DN7173_c0_g1_i1:13-1083(-)